MRPNSRIGCNLDFLSPTAIPGKARSLITDVFVHEIVGKFLTGNELSLGR